MENTENKLNEIDVIVGNEAENKSMFQSKENVSTELANKGDSGIHTSENNDEVSFTDSNIESQLTESRIMEGVTSQSTPTLVKKEDNSDMIIMMQLLLSKFDSKFDEQKKRNQRN